MDEIDKLPETMLGALSKREQETLIQDKKKEAELGNQEAKPDTVGEEDDLNDGHEWDTEINMEKEKAMALDVLAKFVP